MSASDAEFIQRARDLAPAIQSRAAESAKLRKPHDDSIRDLIESGLIRMAVPKRWGGAEASLTAIYDVLKILSAADPAFGWIASFYIMHNPYVARFSEQAQEELFGENGYVLMPAASAPNMKATKVNGGWEVSGRAIWGSGIMHADWTMISGDAEGVQRSFLIPASEVEVIDNWDYAGMSGTGSADFVADKVFVPDHRTIKMDDFFAGNCEGAKIHDNPLYNLPFFISAYSTILPVIAGSFEGAVQAYKAIVERRVRNFTGTVVKEQQAMHINLGDFEITALVADDMARTAFGVVTDNLGQRNFTLEDRVTMKQRTAFMSNLCRNTVSRMMTVSGSSSFHNDQPLQKYWRDLNTVCSHAFWDWDITREVTGRQSLGLEPTYFLL